MTTVDEEIGQVLSAVRGDRSQQSVADAMRELGWKWSQATVWSVEKGERPLRLSESLDLARVLDTTVEVFLSGPRSGIAWRFHLMSLSTLDQLQNATRDFAYYRWEVDRAIAEAIENGEEMSTFATKMTMDVDEAVDKAVEFGRQEWRTEQTMDSSDD